MIDEELQERNPEPNIRITNAENKIKQLAISLQLDLKLQIDRESFPALEDKLSQIDRNIQILRSDNQQENMDDIQVLKKEREKGLLLKSVLEEYFILKIQKQFKIGEQLSINQKRSIITQVINSTETDLAILKKQNVQNKEDTEYLELQLKNAQRLLKLYEKKLKESKQKNSEQFFCLLKKLKISEDFNLKQDNSKMIQDKKRAIEIKIGLNKRKNLSQQQMNIKRIQLQQQLKWTQRLRQLYKQLYFQQYSIKEKQKINDQNQNLSQRVLAKESLRNNNQNQLRLSYLSKSQNNRNFIIFQQNNKQLGKAIIDTEKSILDILTENNIDFRVQRRYKISLQNQEGNTKSINLFDKICDLIDCWKEDLICTLQQIFIVNTDTGTVKQFKKGTPLDSIKQKLNNLKVDYYFFKDHKQYKQKFCNDDLSLLECCKTKIKYKGRIYKGQLVPIRVSSDEIVKYILPQISLIKTSFIHKINLQGQQVKVPRNAKLDDIAKGKQIKEILISYSIELTIDIAYLSSSTTVLFVANVQQKIKDLKKKFQTVCNFSSKLQKWINNTQQINEEQTLESVKFSQDFYTLEVQYTPNLEYYGFNDQESVPDALFKSFYVENEEQFLQQIQNQNFPQSNYQFAFRRKAYSKIFSVIKKHCRISTAIDSIKSIVSKSKSKKQYNLWKSNSTYQKSYFNQFFVLNNILISTSSAIQAEIMRTYKHHSSLPLKTCRINNKIQDLSQIHYWIATKSMNIVSFQLASFVKGKSTLINYIFNTDFQISNLRHPLCSNTAWIKYDIYRNDKYQVSLIDVPSGVFQKKELFELCSYANMFLIHLYERQIQQIKEWVENNFPNIPVIYICRDSNLMDNPQAFQSQMKENNQLGSHKLIYVPVLNENNLSYHQNKFSEISDTINEFVIKLEKNMSNEEKWKLTEYFQRKNGGLNFYTKKLKNLEKCFSTVIDTKLIQDANDIDIQFQIPKQLLQLVEIPRIDDTSLFFAKMKEFARLERINSLKKFDPLNKISTIIQKKSQIRSKRSQIDTLINQLKRIKKQQTCEQFQKSLLKYDFTKESEKYEENIIQISKQLNFNFKYIIKVREFSIQNFWRFIVRIYNNEKKSLQDVEFKNIRQQIKTKCDRIFQIQFEKGKTLELINGNTLEIPINILRKQASQYENKKIMVVGIVGGQSSGKSTLLNFLFGCDFLSSDGRCTSGVYSSYYQVEGQNIPGCDGILVLDTEGLFGNYERVKKEGENFDNKLVLFLLKICDVLIVNVRGDIQKDIQNVFQLSFDCQLFQDKPGTRYPNLQIVLNYGNGMISQQAENQIITFRDKIIQSAPKMSEYINPSNQSNSIPTAFSSGVQNGFISYIKSIQMPKKIPTVQFYQSTRNLSLKIMKILRQRGRKFEHKELQNIYQEMYSTWSMLIRSQIITKYSNKKMKHFAEKVQKWKANLVTELKKQEENWAKQLCCEKLKQIHSLIAWEEQQKGKLKSLKQQKLAQMQSKFRSPLDFEKNKLLQSQKSTIKAKFETLLTKLAFEVNQKKMNIQFEASKNRGIDQIAKLARKMKKERIEKSQYTTQQKEKQFKKIWSKITEDLKKKIDQRQNGSQLLRNINECYSNHLREIFNQEPILQQSINILDTDFDLSQEQFFDKLKDEFGKKLLKYSPIQPISRALIISISATENTDLKYKYLDMRQFFELKMTKRYYYFGNPFLYTILNKDQIKKYIQEKMENLHQIKDFSEQLYKDFNNLQVKVNTKAINREIVEQLQNIKNSTKSWKFKNEWIKSLNQKDKKKLEKIIGFFKKERQNFIDLQKQTKNHSYFNRIYNFLPWKKSQYQYQPYEQHFTLITQEFITKFMSKNQKIQQISNRNCEKLIKDMILDLLNQFIARYQKRYLQKKQQVKQQVQEKLRRQLLKINISICGPLKYQKKLRQLGIKEVPVQLKAKSDIIERLQQFSDLFNKRNILNYLQDHEENVYQQSIPIAWSQSNKIVVRKQYQNSNILSLYKDKQVDELYKRIKQIKFVNFVKQHINFIKIFEEINNSIKQLPQCTTIQHCISVTQQAIRRQLQIFNLDLRQISQQLSKHFINQLHWASKMLLWKKLEIQLRKQNKSKESKLAQHQQIQRKIFFGILDKDPYKACEADSKLVANNYKSFLEQVLKDQKKAFLEEKRRQFYSKTSRKLVQQKLEQQLMNCKKENAKDIDKVFNYLLDPAKQLKKQHNNDVEAFIKDMNAEFTTQIFEIFNQMNTILTNDAKNLKGTQSQWESNALFTKYVQDTPTLLKQIFIELLLKGNTITRQKKQNQKYNKLNEGVVFQIEQRVCHPKNKRFLTEVQNFEISNYAIFFQQLSNQLKILKEKLFSNPKRKITEFSSEQLSLFEASIQLQICTQKCPCCDKLCDIDMRIDSSHVRHRCDSGHQMRAIKGIRVEKTSFRNKKYLAQVMRCEDSLSKMKFQYYDKEYRWQQFVKEKPEWFFPSKNQVNEENYKNQEIFLRHVWDVCGQKICQYFSNKGKQMSWISYDSSAKLLENTSLQAMDFIFAIDGSSSMSGVPWQSQLNQLKKILGDISANSDNTVSILVFNTDVYAHCIRKDPSQVDVRQIRFPEGGTDPGPTFEKVAQIIDKSYYNNKKSFFFFYISDGLASHPTKGIRKLLQCRSRLENANLELKYTSILIGQYSVAMEKINAEMGGRSFYTQNASKISSLVREVLQA